MHDTPEKLSTRTIGLHWFIALGVIALLAMGHYLEDMKNDPFKFQLLGIHKSLGVLIFPFALYRIIWRMQNGFPEPVGTYSTIEHILAKIVHYTLILGTILMPISGMMMSAAGGYGIPFFGLELVSPNFVDGKAVPLNSVAAGIGHKMHGIGGKLLVLAIALHVAGALKHFFIDKDGTLQRMLGTRLDRKL